MQEFLTGIAGNFISALVLALIPLIIIVTRSSNRQRQAASFFGLDPRKPVINILLSRYQPVEEVEILEGDVPSRGYTHETVAVDEFEGAQAIQALFKSNWIVTSIASIFEAIWSGRPDFARVNVDIKPVGRPASYPEDGTVILMGTGARDSNGLAEKFLGGEERYSIFRFIKNEEKGRGFERMRVKGFSEEPYYASERPGELAVLQRTTMEDGRVVFLCAGKDIAGSKMAAQYLAMDWTYLHKTYKDGSSNGDFAILYQFGRTFEKPDKVDVIL